MRSLIVLALVSVAACGDDASDATDDGTAVPRETITETKLLIGSEIAEGTLEGSDRAVIRVTSTTAELDWNIHGHVDDETTIIDEGLQVMEFETDFTPPGDGHWLLLLRNHSAVDPLEVSVEIDLYGELEWESFGAHDE